MCRATPPVVSGWWPAASDYTFFIITGTLGAILVFALSFGLFVKVVRAKDAKLEAACLGMRRRGNKVAPSDP